MNSSDLIGMAIDMVASLVKKHFKGFHTSNTRCQKQLADIVERESAHLRDQLTSVHPTLVTPWPPAPMDEMIAREVIKSLTKDGYHARIGHKSTGQKQVNQDKSMEKGPLVLIVSLLPINDQLDPEVSPDDLGNEDTFSQLLGIRRIDHLSPTKVVNPDGEDNDDKNESKSQKDVKLENQENSLTVIDEHVATMPPESPIEDNDWKQVDKDEAT